MPGVFQLSVDEIVKEAAAAKADGVPGVLLFGLPESKDEAGSGAADPEGPVQSAVRALKKEVPGLLVVTDVCLCEYTSHGHCGILDGEESTTTRPSTSWRAPRCRTPPPAPTSSPRPT